MRLSDIKGDRVFDVIADITGPVINIASDKDARRLFRKEAPPAGVAPKAFALQKISRCVPALLRGHKDDLVTILASIKGVSKDEYLETLDLCRLTVDVFELLNDEEFLTFFTSAMQTLAPSAAPAETTEAPAG